MTAKRNIPQITKTLAYNLGIWLANRGYNDKRVGRKPLSLVFFEKATKNISNEENNIAQLLYENYMIGYNGKKK